MYRKKSFRTILAHNVQLQFHTAQDSKSRKGKSFPEEVNPTISLPTRVTHLESRAQNQEKIPKPEKNFPGKFPGTDPTPDSDLIISYKKSILNQILSNKS
jgi:hypothetical protein